VGQDALNNTGFSEAYADELFTSLVKVDQVLASSAVGDSGIGDGTGKIYDSKGKLIRNQGELFDSTLHFIGFGRGAVVNTEIVQRLGTFYPLAGGKKLVADQITGGDLQVTSVDPYDQFGGMVDPALQTWSNVTFADLYYQNLPAGPAGQGMNGNFVGTVDWKVDLSGAAGLADRTKNVFSWYEGTADLAEPVKPGAFRRLGDLAPSDAPWYRPEHLAVSPGLALNPIAGMPSEGIGEGWFYSVLGGGARLRPLGERTLNGQLAQAKGIRKDVGVDNTSSSRMRGDYAVPTLFDGNFDAITAGASVATSTALVPGWDAAQSKLVNVHDTTLVPTLQGHFDKLGVDRSQPNYAVKLNAGDSISHNGFVTPDWGTLRFDLHTTNDVQKGSSLGQLKVFLDEVGAAASTTPIQFIDLQEAEGTADQYSADRWRIGYGETGFETFTIDVPDALRGKVATLRFELSGGEVFVDNVFFKSQHLLLGNPSDARYYDSPVPPTATGNYLLEKPQYAISYNADKKGPNWASYEINSSWLENSSPTRPNWEIDPEVPFSNVVNNPDYVSARYTKGHLTDAAIRNRNLKDYISTFLLSNTLPQAPLMNSEVWAEFETDLRKLSKNQGRDVYVVTGGRGSLNNDPIWIDLLGDNNLLKAGVNIPSHFWKVAIILDRSGLNVSSLNDSLGGGIVDLIAIDVPNDLTDPRVESKEWSQWRKSVDQIESLTGLDFLSNLSDDVERRVEANINFQRYVPPSSLLAETEPTSQQPITLLKFPVRHNGTVNDNASIFTVSGPEKLSTFQVGLSEVNVVNSSLEHFSSYQSGPSQISISQVSSGQISRFQDSSFKNSTLKVGITQIGSIQSGLSHPGTDQISPLQIGITQITPPQISTNQISLTEVDSRQIDSAQVGFSQVNSTEISFPSSITLQQFLTGHNSSFQNTTIPTWTEFLTGTTPFNLKIEITDLPTGQLAEANITRFDSNGRPTSGTLTLDTDANGLGWF
jgi:DNA/RNA endonuclease G (NUC1)